MSTERLLLDTSALLTLIEDEDGAERVEDALVSGGVLVHWISLVELYYVSVQRGGEEEADLRHALVKQLPIQLIDEMDEPTLLIAARWKARFRISLADALIAATARRQDATLLHKDPEYEALHAEIWLESLPYKSNASGASAPS